MYFSGSTMGSDPTAEAVKLILISVCETVMSPRVCVRSA